VGDAVYRTLAGTFVYDPIPVDAVTESVDSTDADFIREVVTVSTVYGDERMPIHIFRPHGPARARQVVVLFPGSNAFGETVRGDPRNFTIDALVRSGRIVVWPTYASQYERRHTLDSDAPRETAKYRDHVAMWVKDARRAVDYIVTRPDVDSSRIAYFGFSFGGRMAPIILALEPRFKAAMLNVAGLKMERPRPESDPLHFLPRVRIPVLMLNGEFDHYFPLETSQKPFFAMLGTPAAQKRHVVFQGGHSVPRTIFLTEGLRWLDTYLGPVER
jgi:dienelactone hydrolase